jgi:signal transduction histidine kinase
VTAAPAVGGWLVAAGLALSSRWAAVSRADGVAQACHELRGPLSAIGLGVELASRTGQLPAGRVQALELELGRARQALDDLAVAGGVRARAHPTRAAADQVPLGTLLRESAEAWRDAAGSRQMRVELPPGGEVFVTGERLRLAQALGNLLANAVEHGEGDVIARLRATATVARIDICDGGRGLPAPLADLIGSGCLRRWYQWLPPMAVSERGHGLRIVAGIAASHGGRLICAPSERGARLVLELPLTRADSAPRAVR